MRPVRLARAAGVPALLLALGLTGCGGGSTPPAASTSPSPSASASTSSAQAVAEVKANWAAFFDPATPNDKRVQLLENGQQFAAAITALLNSPAAKSAKFQVKDATVNGTTATVTYDVLLNGSPVLTDQKGTEVYADGTWKISIASFCGLLQQQGGQLPAACPSASAAPSASASG